MNSLHSNGCPLGAAIRASRSDVLKVAVGFSPRNSAPPAPRRVATLEPPIRSQASLRDAALSRPRFRGLKPTATVASSLCDGPRRIPTGFRPPAQGCAARATLGQGARNRFNPNGVAPCPTEPAPQPRWGCHVGALVPRVGAARQPWAGGHNPFGIEARAATPAPSRSDAVKVAVGFSPRRAIPSSQRRVATLESRTTLHASLRDAGALTVGPWAEAHGYLHPTSLRDCRHPESIRDCSKPVARQHSLAGFTFSGSMQVRPVSIL